MMFYYIIAALLWLIAAGQLTWPRFAPHADRLALAIYLTVAGLRFETGYDWIGYQRFFAAVNDPAICYKGPSMEPLFWGLAKLTHLISHDVQLLFFLITAINAGVLWLFCRRFNCRFALAAAIIFGWMYLTLYMGALRQSLAMSAVLLAFLLLTDRRRIAAGLVGLTALGFQFSSLLTLPLLVRAPWRMLLRYAPYFCAGCVLYLYFMPSPASILIYIFIKLDIGFLSDKLETYQALGTRVVTLPMIGYLLLNIGFLLYARAKLVRDSIDIMLLSPLMLMMFFQATMADFPIFWMRIMFLAVTCQAVFVGRTLERVAPRLRLPYLLAVMLLSFAALAYFFRDEAKVTPYMPYQNVTMKYHRLVPEKVIPPQPVTNSGQERTEKFYKHVEETTPVEVEAKLSQTAERTRTGCIDLTLHGYLTRETP